MEKTLQVIVSQWQDETLKAQVEETFKSMVECRVQDVLVFVEDQLFSQANILPYIRLLQHIPQGVCSERFLNICLFKISQITQQQYRASSQCILQYSQKPQIEQALEEAIIAMSGDVSRLFFSCELPAELRQREDIIKFCTTLRPADGTFQISHPLILRFAVLSVRGDAVPAMLRQVLMQFTLFGEYGFVQNCILFMYLLSIQDDAATLVEPLQTELAGALQYFYMLLSNTNSMCTRFVLLIWYFCAYRHANPLSFIGYHEMAVKQFLRLYEQWLGQHAAAQQILQETQFIARSPVLCKMLGVEPGSGDEGYLRQIYQLLCNAMAQVLQQNEQIAALRFGRFLQNCSPQELAQLQIQPSTAKSLIQISFNVLLAVQTTQYVGRVFSKVLAQRLMAAGVLQQLFELVESAFASQKNKISCLQFISLILEQSKLPEFAHTRAEALAFTNKMLGILLFKDIRLVADGTSVAGFKQRELAFYEKDQQFKIQLTVALPALLRQALLVGLQSTDLLSAKLISNYVCHIVDTYSNVFCLNAPINQTNDAFILNLIEGSAILEQHLISATISTLFTREFQFSLVAPQQQVQQYYYLQMRQYYGCFSMLNLLAHGEHDNKIYIVERFIASGANFIDVLAISIMLLTCVDFESQAMSVVNLREVVLSFLNYIIQISQTQIAHPAVQKFFLDGEQIAYSMLFDNTEAKQSSAQIMLRQAQCFVGRILRSFNFSKFNIKIDLSFGMLFPGAKWQTYSQEKMFQIAKSNFIQAQHQDSSYDADSQYVSQYEDQDTEQIDTLMATQVQVTALDQVDEYMYAIFEFVAEIMSLVTPEVAFMFYRRCYQTKLIQSTSNIKQRQIQFRLSLLGFLPSLLQLPVGTVLLAAETPDSALDSVISQLIDIILNSHDLVTKQMLRINDLMYLVQGASAANLKAFLLCFKTCQNRLLVKNKLHVLQAGLLRPCVSDIIQRFEYEHSPGSSDTSAVFVPKIGKIDNSLINVLIQLVDSQTETKAYRQLCQLCFAVIQQIDLIGEYSAIASGDLIPSVQVLIQYLLENSAFGPVLKRQLLVSEREMIFSMSAAQKRTIGQIYDSNGLAALFGYFQRKDYVEVFQPYQLHDYIRVQLENNALAVYSEKLVTVNGLTGHCMKLWTETVDHLIILSQNLKLPTKIALFIFEKAFTVIDSLQNNESIQMIYDSHIGPRLLALAVFCVMSHFTGRVVHQVVDYMVSAILSPSYQSYCRERIINLALQCLAIFQAHFQAVYAQEIAVYQINPLGLRHVFFAPTFGNMPESDELVIQLLAAGSQDLLIRFLVFACESDVRHRLDGVSTFYEAFSNYLTQRHTALGSQFDFLLKLIEGQRRYRLVGDCVCQRAINTVISALGAYVAENRDCYYRLISAIVGCYTMLPESLQTEHITQYSAVFQMMPQVVYAYITTCDAGNSVLMQLLRMPNLHVFFIGAQRFFEKLIACWAVTQSRHPLLQRMCTYELLILKTPSYADQAIIDARKSGVLVFAILCQLAGEILFSRTPLDIVFQNSAADIMHLVAGSQAVDTAFNTVISLSADSVGVGQAFYDLISTSMGACQLQYASFDHFTMLIAQACAPLGGYVRYAQCIYVRAVLSAVLIMSEHKYEFFEHITAALADKNLQQRHHFVDIADRLLEQHNCAQLILEFPQFDFDEFALRQLNRQQLPRVLAIARNYAQCFATENTTFATELLGLLLNKSEQSAAIADVLGLLVSREPVRQVVQQKAVDIFGAAEREESRSALKRLLTQTLRTQDECEVLQIIGGGNYDFLQKDLWGFQNLFILVKNEKFDASAYLALLAEALQNSGDKQFKLAMIGLIREAVQFQ